MAKKTKHDLMAAMLNHLGMENSVSSRQLSIDLDITERKVR